jgi:hypothetical protein
MVMLIQAFKQGFSQEVWIFSYVEFLLLDRGFHLSMPRTEKSDNVDRGRPKGISSVFLTHELQELFLELWTIM